MIAVDDAQSSPFFGNVYVCNAAFRSQEIGGFPEPIVLNASSDGGNTWRTTQLSAAVDNNLQRRPPGLPGRTPTATARSTSSGTASTKQACYAIY